MSLVVCLKAEEGWVLAADSRGSRQVLELTRQVLDPTTIFQDNQAKITQVGKCGLAMLGDSELGYALLSETIFHGREDADTIRDDYDIETLKKALFQDCGSVCRSAFSGLFQPMMPVVEFVIVGYSSVGNGGLHPLGYELHSKRMFTPVPLGHSKPHSFGVSNYADFVLRKHFKGAGTIRFCEQLAELAISAAAQHYSAIGGKIQIAEIKPTEGFRFLDEAEVSELHSMNESFEGKVYETFAELADDKPAASV